MPVTSIDVRPAATRRAPSPAPREARPKLWRPRRVLVTPSALEWAHGAAIAERAAGLGIEVERLPSDRLTGLGDDDPRKAYARAKSTLAVVVAPPSKRRLQPIPPSADWRFDLAEGCPAHCQYCYLAGSLKGPPVTRVYANLPEILGGLADHVGRGTITSRSRGRAHEGTTFEASCYTDPLGIEHLTASLAAAIRHFGARDADAQLRFTTKFDDVGPLLRLAHGGRTRVRFSVNSATGARFEGGTAPVAARLTALRRTAQAGYPVGLTIAPILAAGDWRAEYRALIDAAADALDGVPRLDLTAELITHRFTPGSKEVLLGWYPGTGLAMDEAERAEKRNKFGGRKHVYPPALMAELRGFFERTLAERLPAARVLYWT